MTRLKTVITEFIDVEPNGMRICRCKHDLHRPPTDAIAL